MTFGSLAVRAMLKRFLFLIWKTGRQPEKRFMFHTPCHYTPCHFPSDQVLHGTIVNESERPKVLTYCHMELWQIQTGRGGILLFVPQKNVTMEVIMEKQYSLIEIETFIEEFMRATGPAARRQVIRDHLKESPWWEKQDQDKTFTGERDGYV